MQDLSSKLYLCHYKTPFYPAKGNLPTAAHRGDCIAVSPCEICSGKPINRCIIVQLRLTPEEAALLKEKSASYSSVSHYIRSAVAEHSNIDAKKKLELINDLGLFYRKFQNELSWAGGNLNQSVKRANELAVAGLLAPEYIQEVLMPTILEARKTLNGIKKELDAVTRKAVKL